MYQEIVDMRPARVEELGPQMINQPHKVKIARQEAIGQPVTFGSPENIPPAGNHVI